jgi:hypothetical protein
MTYKQVLIPDKKNHTIEMPEQFFGRKVEVTVVEIDGSDKNSRPVPPQGRKTSINELFENFGANTDFPTTEEIRAKAWLKNGNFRYQYSY